MVFKINVPKHLAFVFAKEIGGKKFDGGYILFKMKDDKLSKTIDSLIQTGALEATSNLSFEEYAMYRKKENEGRGLLILN